MAAKRIDRQRRQKRESRKMLPLAEDMHGQDGDNGRGPNCQRSPSDIVEHRGEPQDTRCCQQRGGGKRQDQAIGDVSWVQAERARKRNAGQIGKDRHGWIDFDDIDIQPLTVQHAFADNQQPAHIRIQGDDLPQQNRDNEHEGDQNPRQG